MGGSTVSSLSHPRIGLVTQTTSAQEATLFYPAPEQSLV